MHECANFFKILKDPTCAIFFKCMGFKDIKYDIPLCHECHKGHEGKKVREQSNRVKITITITKKYFPLGSTDWWRGRPAYPGCPGVGQEAGPANTKDQQEL